MTESSIVAKLREVLSGPVDSEQKVFTATGHYTLIWRTEVRRSFLEKVEAFVSSVLAGNKDSFGTSDV